jgi:hypothetical protein
MWKFLFGNPLTPKPTSLFGVQKVALFEMGLFFVIVFAIDLIFGSHTRFAAICPHPFWIIVLLMTVQYGTVEGALATLMSTFLLYVGNLPEQALTEDLFAYQLRLMTTPIEWLISAFILGGIQDRKTRLIKELERRTHMAEAKEREMTYIYERMKHMKEHLEARIAGDLRSSIAIYRAIKKLGATQPAQVLFGLEEFVSVVLRPQKCSLFALGGSGLEAASNVGWEPDDHYTRRFPPDTSLYLSIVGEQRVLSILNREDQLILRQEGVLAAPLVDEASHTIFGMLKVEELDLEELNLANIEAFRLICEAAGLAYAQAREFQRLKNNTLVDGHLPLYSARFYQIMRVYLEKIWCFLDLPLALIRLNLSCGESEAEEKQILFVNELKDLVHAKFGDFALITKLDARLATLAILLPCMDKTPIDFFFPEFVELLNKVSDRLELKLKVRLDWLGEEDAHLG